MMVETVIFSQSMEDLAQKAVNEETFLISRGKDVFYIGTACK